MISGIYSALFSKAIKAPDRLHLNQTENMAHTQMRESYPVTLKIRNLALAGCLSVISYNKSWLV